MIRPEQAGDRKASLDVQRAAFGDDAEASIVVAVRDEEGSFALVAEEDGVVVGHVQLSRAWVGTQPVLALGPIGVIHDHQGKGLGRALINAAADEARVRREVAVILLGDPRLYPRFGYQPASRFGLRNPFTGARSDGFRIAEEDFMILPLSEGASKLRGEIRWHPAFG